jgi:hypothetical protein
MQTPSLMGRFLHGISDWIELAGFVQQNIPLVRAATGNKKALADRLLARCTRFIDLTYVIQSKYEKTKKIF